MESMIWELSPNGETAEAIGSDGDCYLVAFSGPDAKKRAAHYVEVMNRKQLMRKDLKQFARQMNKVLNAKEIERVANSYVLYPEAPLHLVAECCVQHAMELDCAFVKVHDSFELIDGALPDLEKHAVHVANYAMMVWQKIQKLKAKEEIPAIQEFKNDAQA